MKLENLVPQKRRLSARGGGYSWFVKITRLVLPIVALVLIGVVAARLSKDPVQDQMAQLPQEEMPTPGEIALETPKYEGMDEKGQPYVVTAQKAVRASDNENIYDLEMPQADITLQAGNWLAVKSNAGRFDNAAGTLDLQGDVRLFHDAGYELQAQDMHVDLKGKTAHTNLPVQGQGPAALIAGQNMHVAPGGMQVIIGGPATLTLHRLKGDKAG